MNKEFLDAIEYIGSIPRFAKKTELDNTRHFLRLLGDPQNSYKCVHIAGTNGKGSVARMMALMLEKTGYKTGLFVSPHLVRINERMSVNGTDISDEDFYRVFEQIKSVCNVEVGPGDLYSLGHGSVDRLEHPAYFEFLFLMACVYFKEQGCDYVVFETGLGGRLDATNVLKPEISIISSIGMDHMQYLGNTIEEIAGEKAGIIKPGIPVVFNTGSDKADKVIIDKCRELSTLCVPASGYGSDIIEEFAEKNGIPYQKDNACTAVTAYKLMFDQNDQKYGISDKKDFSDIISEALDEFSWPARMQFVDKDTVLDGAHNEDAVIRLCEAVKQICKKQGYGKVYLMFAAVDDKDHESVIKHLCDNMMPEKVFLTEISSGRKMDADELKNIFSEFTDNDIAVIKSVREAYKTVKEEVADLNGDGKDKILLVIAGSLYLAGEILQLTTNE